MKGPVDLSRVERAEPRGVDYPCDEADYWAHVRCCWMNPVKHGFVARPEDWPFSRVASGWAVGGGNGAGGEGWGFPPRGCVGGGGGGGVPPYPTICYKPLSRSVASKRTA